MRLEGLFHKIFIVSIRATFALIEIILKMANLEVYRGILNLQSFSPEIPEIFVSERFIIVVYLRDWQVVQFGLCAMF